MVVNPITIFVLILDFLILTSIIGAFLVLNIICVFMVLISFLTQCKLYIDLIEDVPCGYFFIAMRFK